MVISVLEAPFNEVVDEDRFAYAAQDSRSTILGRVLNALREKLTRLIMQVYR